MANGIPPVRAEQTSPMDTSQEAFRFVQALASELTSGTVSIPSLPDVALRIQRLLADESTTTERIVRVLGAEPALAARILSMANSVALNPAGQRIADLRTAVTRLGADMLRSAALAFAMGQLQAAEQYRAIGNPLKSMWRRSIEVASLCRVIAQRHRELSVDAALLVGLLHGVGKLYILTRATRHPLLFADQSTYQDIVRDWHADIAKALLEGWKIDDELIEAIHGFEDPERVGRGPLALGDVLVVADIMASLRSRPDLLELRLGECSSADRLGIGPANLEQVLNDCNAEINALKDALGY
ncbi:MAG: HDOD domain-containing protein [Sinobacteraceae bacterium]|nr:HDOD domain-containing protein [Nevskiaceae bacterium]MCP5472166.1 HDOD domain-containing protein [Nevskiaceae bacterium]